MRGRHGAILSLRTIKQCEGGGHRGLESHKELPCSCCAHCSPAGQKGLSTQVEGCVTPPIPHQTAPCRLMCVSRHGACVSTHHTAHHTSLYTTHHHTPHTTAYHRTHRTHHTPPHLGLQHLPVQQLGRPLLRLVALCLGGVRAAASGQGGAGLGLGLW